MTNEPNPGPLDGMLVIEWSIWHQGSAVGYMLGDLGAQVIKIEQPEGDPLRGLLRFMGVPVTVGSSNTLFELANRSKKSVTLDLKSEGGREALYRLVEKADVFVTNFHRLDVRERLGVDYKRLSGINERLVYAVCSGQGLKGPDADLSAFDNIAVARSGFMYSIGEKDSPPQPMVFGLADQIGATVAVYGILAALLARHRTGRGQEVEASLLGAMIHAQAMGVTAALLLDKDLPRPSRTDVFNPLTTYYKCKDDGWLAFSVQQPQEAWDGFCRAINRPNLIDDPRFATTKARGENNTLLVSLIDEALAEKTVEEWTMLFREQRLIFGPVRRFSELAGDEQVQANGYIAEMEHPELGKIHIVGFPVTLSDTPLKVQGAAPHLGQHTEEVLMEIAGYDWDGIADLRSRGAY